MPSIITNPKAGAKADAAVNSTTKKSTAPKPAKTNSGAGKSSGGSGGGFDLLGYAKKKDEERLSRLALSSRIKYNQNVNRYNAFADNQPNDMSNPQEYLGFMRNGYLQNDALAKDSADTYHRMLSLSNEAQGIVGQNGTGRARLYADAIKAYTDASGTNSNTLNRVNTRNDIPLLGSGDTRGNTKVDNARYRSAQINSDFDNNEEVKDLQGNIRQLEGQKQFLRMRAETGDMDAQLEYDRVDTEQKRLQTRLDNLAGQRDYALQPYQKILDDYQNSLKPVDPVQAAVDALNFGSMNPRGQDLTDAADTVTKKIVDLRTAYTSDPEVKSLRQELSDINTRMEALHEKGMAGDVEAQLQWYDLDTRRGEIQSQLDAKSRALDSEIKPYQTALNNYQWYHRRGDKLKDGLTEEEYALVMKRPVAVSRNHEFVNPDADEGTLPSTVNTAVSNDAMNLLEEKFGKEEAKEYAEYIERLHNAEDAQKRTKKLNDLVQDNALKGTALSLASVPQNLVGGVIGAIDTGAQWVDRIFTDRPFDYNSYAQQQAQIAPAIRGAVNQSIERLDIGDLEKKALQIGYSTGLSMLDSKLAMSIGGRYGGLILATSAGVQGLQEAKQRGLSDEQAILTGLMNGANEAIWETISIDKLLSMRTGKNWVQKWIINPLIQGGIEGSEELNTTLANTFIDLLQNGENSKWKQDLREYKRQGYSDEEAKAMVWKELGAQLRDDVIGGFLSGAIMGAGQQGKLDIRNRSTGNRVFSNGTQKAVASFIQNLTEVKEMPEIQEMAQKLADGTLTKTQTGELVNEAIDSLSEKARSGGDEGRRARGKILLLEGLVNNAITNQDAQNQRQNNTENTAVSEQGETLRSAQAANENAQTSAENAEQARMGDSALLKADEADVGGYANVTDASGIVNRVLAEGVQQAEDGTLMVQTRALDQDGRPIGETVLQPVSNVQFEDETTARLYRDAQDMALDADEAASYIAGMMEGADIEQYAQAFAQVQALAAEMGPEADIDTVVNAVNAVNNDESMDAASYIHMETMTDAALQAAVDSGVRMYQQTQEQQAPVQTQAETVEEQEATEEAQEERAAEAEQQEAAAEEQEEQQEEKELGAFGTMTDELWESLTEEQQDTIFALNEFAERIGRTINIVEHLDAPKGKTRNGMFDPNTNEYTIALDAIGEAYLFIALHESVHDIAVNNETGYTNLKNVVFEVLEKHGEDVQALIREARNGIKGDMTWEQRQERAEEEVIANTIPALLNDENFARQFAERFAQEDADTRSTFEKWIDKIKDVLKKAYNLLKRRKAWRQMRAIENDQKAIDRIREAYFDALEGRTNQPKGGDVRYGERNSIVDDGQGHKYVVWDRAVIHGDDPNEWGRQVTDYINNEIRHGRDVRVVSKNGVVLTITEDTAGKAAFRNKVYLPNGRHRSMNDEEYARKLRAESHIDELAQVSKGSKSKADQKMHAFARNGFTYHTAYFMDNTGYYEVTISVGKTGRINTIYNVGKIENAPLPTKRLKGQSRSKTEREGSRSNEIVRDSSEFVNPVDENRYSEESALDAADDAAFWAELGRQQKAEYQAALKAAEQDVENLRKAAKGKGVQRITQEAAREIARRLKTNYNSNAKIGALANDVRTAYEHLFNSDMSSSEAVEETIGILRSMIEDSAHLDEVHELMYGKNARALRRDLKRIRLNMNNTDVHDVADGYGGINNFRKQFMGTFTLVKQGGVGPDVVYDELARSYPEFLPVDLEGSEYSTPMHAIMDFVERSRPRLITEQNLDDKILPAFFDAITYMVNESPMTTPEMRQASKLEETVKKIRAAERERTQKAVQQAREEEKAKRDAISQKYRNAMREQRETMQREYREQTDKKLAQQRANMLERAAKDRNEMQRRYQAQIAKVRDLWRSKYNKAVEHGNERVAEERARQRKTEVRATIRNRVMALNEMIRQKSKNKYVPDRIRLPLAKMLGRVTELLRNPDGSIGRQYADVLENMKVAVTEQLRIQQTGFGETVVEDEYYDLNPELASTIDGLIQRLNDMATRGEVIRDMSEEDLNTLSSVLGQLGRAISRANRFHIVKHFETVDEAGMAAMQYLDEFDPRKVVGKGLRGAQETTRQFMQFENATPVYFFDRFGDAGKEIFKAFRDGWGQLAFNTATVENFQKDTWTSKEAQEWGKQKITAKLSDGKTITMTAANVMELGMLDKREQARGHIYGGGIVLEESLSGNADIEAIAQRLTQADVEKLVSQLNDRQRAVMAKAAKFMQTLAGWGNQVSMERFGVNSFTEENYWTIRTVENGRQVKDPTRDQSDLFRLLNQSFTKATVDNANSPIVIGNFFDTFASHASNMAKYNALGLPLLDAMKWINSSAYMKDGDRKTLRQSVERALGKDAINYFVTLVRGINGNREAGAGASSKVARYFIRSYKIASVGNNLRVALLQPTSFFRAAFVLKAKSLGSGFVNGAFHLRRNYNEAIQHSGTALWKGLGYFSPDTARGLQDRFSGKKTAMDKLVEISMKGAELGDQMTWSMLWQACKNEVQADTGLTENDGNKYWEAVKDKFDDMIYRTQVMDSTLTRSQLMRKTDNFTSVATAFMSEPTLTYNMLMGSIMDYLDARRRHVDKATLAKVGGKAVRAFAAAAVTELAASIVGGLMRAWRDDDEYTGFWEKFWNATAGDFFGSELWENANPLQNIPFVKDLYDVLINGKNAERMDTQALSALYDSIQIWKETSDLANGRIEKPTKITYYGNMTTYAKIAKTIRAASFMSGLPAYNLQREIISAWNNFVRWTMPDHPELFVRSYKGAKTEGYNKLYGALTKKDTQEADRLTAVLMANGADEDAIEKGLTAIIKEETKAGNLTNEQAANRLEDLAGKDNGEKIINSMWQDDIKTRYEEGEINEEQAVKLLQEKAGKDGEDTEDPDITVARWKYNKENKDNKDAPNFSVYGDMREIVSKGGSAKEIADAAKVITDKYGKKEKDVQSEVKKAIYAAWADGVYSTNEAVKLLDKYGGDTKGIGKPDYTPPEKKESEDTGNDYAGLDRAIGNMSASQVADELEKLRKGGMSDRDARSSVKKGVEDYMEDHEYDIDEIAAIIDRLGLWESSGTKLAQKWANEVGD